MHRPRVVLVHGSATDHTTWSIQLGSSLEDRFDFVARDRDFSRTSVAEHAADLAMSIASATRALVVGSSFGAVIALELARTRPDLVVGAVLIEPPMRSADDRTLDSAQREFHAELERRVERDGGPAMGEFFLQSVLGTEAYARIPVVFRERSASRWAEILSDSRALVAYEPRYAALRTCTVPMLLLGGARSAPLFGRTLEALAAALPDAESVTVANAGHMLHAEAPRKFAELLIGFAAATGIE
ncbi:alpha/beta hydrolase [soil metagenome]